MTPPKTLPLAAAALLLAAGAARSQPETPEPYRPAAAWAAQQTRDAERAHADADHVRVRPGVVADREARRVTVYAAATGLAGSDPCEFFLIRAGSGKDYEALALAFARPSDIDAALRFIGAEPGTPVDPQALRFWPKGQRFLMRFAWDQTDETGETTRRVRRVERLILDAQAGEPMPPWGLVYVGSRWRQTDAGERVYAADVSDAQSIASTYNAPLTVFDLPIRAPQGQVYGRFLPHPENAELGLALGTPVTVTLEPDDEERVVELTWRPGPPPNPGEPPRVALVDADGESLVDRPTLTASLAAFDRLSRAGQWVYVTIEPDPPVTLARLRTFYQLVAQVEGPRGVRVEPPPAGHLYYRAFLPDPAWRQRDQRVLDGWDLRLRAADRGLEMRLESASDRRTPDGDWQTVVTVHPVETPQDVADVLREVEDRRARPLFVHAPADLAYGELLRVLGPVLEPPRPIHVFLDAE